MLKKLTVENFTVFEHAEFEFGMLNVIHGENGTGKTHVLKLLYSVLYAAFESDYDPHGPGDFIYEMVSSQLGDHIQEVYKAPNLASLVRSGAARASIGLHGSGPGGAFRCAFGIDATDQGAADITTAGRSVFEHSPNYLPPTPLIHLKSGFALFFDQYHSDFDRTWRDLVINLRAPQPKKLDSAMLAVADQLARESGLEFLLDGADNFYVGVNGAKPVYASLAAEGHRKLVTLLVLIRNGRIAPGTQLFIDEPESNLNPVLLKVSAMAIVLLAQAGVQVFIATHSLFLTREIDIYIAKNPGKVDARFFGLRREDGKLAVHEGPEVADAGELAILAEELKQANEYMELSWRKP